MAEASQPDRPTPRVYRREGAGRVECDLGEIQRLADSFPHYVMLVDADHMILVANQAVFEALGVEPGAIIGGYCPTVVHGTDGPYEGCPLESAKGEHCSLECEVHDKGTNLVMMSGVFPTPYETEGGVRVYLHTTRDISEQRRAEDETKRITQHQELLNDLLRHSLEPLELIELLDACLERILTSPCMDSTGRGAIYVADGSTAEYCLVARRGIEEGVERYEEAPPWLTRRFPIEQSGVRLGELVVCRASAEADDGPEADALPAGVTNVLAGIINRARTEARQREHERVAHSREKMARMGEVASGVAHTIRNPVHGLLNCVSLLEGSAHLQEPDETEVLELMREGLERIERVTKRLLVLSRDVPLLCRPTDVGELLRDACGQWAVLATQHGLQLWVEDTEIEAKLDPDRLLEALGNVIGNAIDACAAGGRVTLSARRLGDGGFRVTVRDTGEGISVEHLARVTDPFFTTKAIGEGSGLGLAITRRIMEEHGGRVQIESEPGHGTQVSLVFGPTEVG